jgi:hypothetical protein
VNLWMKRAIGAAALGGSLLALGAGADGRVLSRLVGSCSGQATGGTAQADRDGIRARVRVPRLASADVSLGTRRTRPRPPRPPRPRSPRADGHRR